MTNSETLGSSPTPSSPPSRAAKVRAPPPPTRWGSSLLRASVTAPKQWIRSEASFEGPHPLLDTVGLKRVVRTVIALEGEILMAKPRTKGLGTTTVNRTVTPTRRPNAVLRTREYLTHDEVEALIEAVKGNRYGHRDATMILVAYRHGLRAAELVDLRWSQVDLDNARMHVRRVKNGVPSVHPLRGDEMRALRKLKREADNSEYVFVSERGSPFTTAGFAKLVERAGLEAGFKFGTHPHMLRHSCGYKLANDGHDTRSLQAYLGHKNIQHTVRYTEMSPTRFKDFWRD
jgi:integrase